MMLSQRIFRIENPQASNGAVSIAEQLGYGYDLVAPARRGGHVAEVIDLSIPTPARPQRRKRRRRRWPRGAVVLRAVPGWGGRTLLAWCPYCHKEHVHGRHGAIEWCGEDCPCALHADLHGRHRCTCPVGSGDGPREAHCRRDSGSPFKGYWVTEVDQ